MPQFLIEQQRIRRSLTGLMAVGFVALSGIVLSAAVLMSANQREMGWIAHTYQVQRQVDAIRLSVTRIQATRWRNAAMPSARSEQAAADARAQLEAAIARFALLTRDNPRHQARVPWLRDAAQVVEGGQVTAPIVPPPPGASLDATGDVMRTGALRPAALLATFRSIADSGPAARHILDLCAVIRGEEDGLLAMRTARLGTMQSAFYAVLGVAGVLLVAVGALIVTTLGAYTRDLNASRRALHAANAGLESAVQERTLDLQRANGELQRFAYIVSHDLRSPLVNVLGFTAELERATAELSELLAVREAAWPDAVDPQARVIIREDLPEAIHFIRSSTQKMDRLINAILRLSREGRRTMHPEAVDLGVLVTAVVDAMRTTIDAAGAVVNIAPGLPTIQCDRLAVEQMIANLIENAVKYARPDVPPVIAVTCARHGPRVAIAIADNGRGIDPRDHQRIFDLFRRAGPQDRPGEGIGLAHVRALAYRLGGTVDVASTPGAGATFTLVLPISFSDSHDQVS